jgi:uncharacterized radical SAM superfamily Fe-S cluster-containing enzyme
MLFIHKTVSLCDKCYRHIPGNVIEQDGQILLKKVSYWSQKGATYYSESDITNFWR